MKLQLLSDTTGTRKVTMPRDVISHCMRHQGSLNKTYPTGSVKTTSLLALLAC